MKGLQKPVSKFQKFLDWLYKTENDSLRHLIYFLMIVAFVGVICDTALPTDWTIHNFATKHANEGWFQCVYYVILYAIIIIYVLTVMYKCAAKDTVESCVFVIFASIAFIIFMDAYLTIITQFNTEVSNEAEASREGFRLLYEMHLNCLMGVVTIICAVAGIKMTNILKKSEKSESNVSNEERGVK